MRLPLLFSRRDAITCGAAATASALLGSSIRAARPFDARVIKRMAAASIPGLALGVSRDGRIAALRTYGLADVAARRPVTGDSMFHIASVTKTVTALAIMRLAEQQRFQLDDPVAPHLDFTISGTDAQRITFRHLLTHTSGISDEAYYRIDFRVRGRDAPLPLGDLLRGYLVAAGRYAGSGNLKTVPGAAWDYSNIGYGLLGYLGTRIAGRDLRAVIQAELLGPLGLRHTAWTIADTPIGHRVTPYDLDDGRVVPVDPVGFPDWAAGMMRSSIADLTRLVAVVANGGVVGKQRIIGAKASAAMLAMTRPPGLPAWLTGQGLAWQQAPLAGVPVANHWGGDPGVFTMAYVDPVRRIGVVLLSNLSATQDSRQALKAIAAEAMAMAGEAVVEDEGVDRAARSPQAA